MGGTGSNYLITLKGKTMKRNRSLSKFRWDGFRNYHRRCAYLIRCCRDKTLDKVNFDTYRLSILWRMRVVMYNEEHGFPAVESMAVKHKLDSYLLTRKTPV